MTLVQRRLLSLVALVAVGAGVFAFVWWSEQEKARDTEQSAKEARLFTLEKAADVTRVALTARGASFMVAREGGAWVVTEPLRAPADASVIDAMVQHALDMQRTGNVEVDGKPPASSELGLYGLDKPRFALTLAPAQGEPQALDVGKKNDFSGALYAKRHGSDVVALVPGALEYQVDKTLFDLREKRVAVFEPEQAEEITVRRGDKLAYTLRRDDKTWRILAPRGMLADEAQAAGVVSALSNVRAVQFIAEHATPEKLATHGLVKPALTADIKLVGGVRKILLIGEQAQEKGDPRYFATLDGEPSPISEVAGDWVMRKVAVDAESLRDLRSLVFEREQVAEIEVRRGERAVRLVKRDEWMIAGADASAPERKADGAKVSGLLYRMFTLRAKAVVKDGATAADLTAAGLDQPQLSVTLRKADGGELGTLLVAGAGGGRATVRGSTRIDAVDAAELEDISAEAAGYAPDAEPAPSAPGDAGAPDGAAAPGAVAPEQQAPEAPADTQAPAAPQKG